MKRSFSFAFLFLSLCPCPANAQDEAPASRPNVLLILADDLGWSDLGCYGGEIATPNLDAVAERGVRFTQFYNTARCWPTRASLMTGYYPQQVNMDPPRGGVPVYALTLAERLKKAGYRSYHAGKWHLRGIPKALRDGGFDHSYRCEDHDRNFYPQHLILDDRALPPVGRDADYYTSTAYADHMIAFLDEHAREHVEQPFFAYLAFTVPHFPLHAPAEDVARYRDRYSEGWDVVRAERVERQRALGLFPTTIAARESQIEAPSGNAKQRERLGPGEVAFALAWKDLTEAQRRFQADKMAVHAAMVDRMDREIGRVLEKVRAMGREEDTLVMFLSDNGASAEILVRGDGHDPDAEPGAADSYLCLGPGWSTCANTPFRRHKIWTHEGGIATPLIVSWPARAMKGAFRLTPGHVIDVTPTLLELAGLPVEPGVEGAPAFPGRSLVPVLEKDRSLDRDVLWFHHVGNRALREGPFKLVSAQIDGDAWELYDLRIDRGETLDLSSAQPERVERMAAAWQAMQDAFVKQAREARKRVFR